MNAPNPNAGRFVWRELMTTDVARAKAFYTAVFDWTYTDWDMSHFVYSGINVGQTGIGGIMPAPSDATFPPNWGSYLGVDDVDATAALAVELGGEVVYGPDDIPNVGRFAVIRDNTGAVFTAFREAVTPPPLPERPVLHGFCWETVTTADSAKTIEFYHKLAGWTTKPGAGAANLFHTAAGAMIADIQPAGEAWPPVWTTYVLVEKLTATLTRVVANGGTVVVPLIPVPGFGSAAVFADPMGAVLCIFEPAMG
jgi:predicted enzyme related to lactoylglutathione lyase